MVGYEKVEFLGHLVAKGQLAPNKDKLDKIRDALRDITENSSQIWLQSPAR